MTYYPDGSSPPVPVSIRAAGLAAVVPAFKTDVDNAKRDLHAAVLPPVLRLNSSRSIEGAAFDKAMTMLCGSKEQLRRIAEYVKRI